MTGRGPLDALRAPLLRRLGRDPGSERAVAGRGDEGVAILMVIMLMLVVATLGITITASVVNQSSSAVYSQKNSQTVVAAEAGLQAGLSQMRTAKVTGATYGSAALLPCSMSGTVGTSTTLTYTTAISYFTSDPTSMTAAQRTANALSCSTTSGLTVDPGFAVLTATGAVRAVGATTTTAGDRVLTSIYTFKSTNANSAGGQIYSFAGDFCLAATPASGSGVTSGTGVTYVAASKCAKGNGLQTWQWDDDYRIRLSSTVTSDYSGLCITGGFSGTTTVTLTDCGNKSSTDHNDQLFSFQGGSKYLGQNSGNTGNGSTCLWAGSQTTSLAGVALVSSSGGCSSSDDDWGSFSPDARVGAGGASHSTNQLVNYQQFGRCFDVNGQNINATYMILYPCKQDPTGKNGFTWNQQEYYTEPASGSSAKQTITVVYSSTTYCLTTPAKGVSPAYPTFSTCTSGAASQQWVRTSKVTGDYTTSYVFTDTYGRCLSVGPIPSSSSWSSVIAATCTGGAEQKWNAPANAVDATTSGTQEVVRGSS